MIRDLIDSLVEFAIVGSGLFFGAVVLQLACIFFGCGFNAVQSII